MTARLALLPILLLALAGCEPAEPYFAGTEPTVDAITPSWESGNIGGQVVLSYIDNVEEPSEEERTLLADYVVSISGDFSECFNPLVTFGNRNATVVRREESALSVLTPPGPISGGSVEVAVVCEEGVKRIEDGYDYVLGDAVSKVSADEATEDLPAGTYLNAAGQPARRLEDLYANEYGSMAIIYPAEPFMNWPDPQLIGFVHTQRTPRNSAYYLTNGQPEIQHGGWAHDAVFPTYEYENEARAYDPDATVPGDPPVPPEPFPGLLAQQPGLDWDAAPMGEEVSAGDAISFFRRRTTSTGDALGATAIKVRNTNPLAPDPNSPAPHDPTQTPNNSGVWFEVSVEGTPHFLRAAQWTGSWCSEEVGREGCQDPASASNEDEEAAIVAANLRLDNTRIGFDWRPRWFVPDEPDRAMVDDYPEALPEFGAYLDCFEAGGAEDDCLEQIGFMIPTGMYQNVRVIHSSDESDQWPWLTDGFVRVIEVLPEVHIEEGGNYIDLPDLAVGQALFDDENPNRVFYLASSLGENVMPRGEPVYISYPGGFYRGVSVPEKNPDMEFPDCSGDDPPAPGTDCYDEFPWVQVPNVEFGTFFNGQTVGAPTYEYTVDDPRDPWDAEITQEWSPVGLNIWIPLSQSIPGAEDHAIVRDLRIPLPGGMFSGLLQNGNWSEATQSEDDMADGVWGDQTFFVAELGVRDLDGPGGFGAAWLWRSKLFAWAGEDYIVFPKEQLATLPRIGDITRDDNEIQENDNLLGSYSLNVRRVASFPIGEPFTDGDGRMVFDMNTMTTYYFRTEHSCFDGVDNDGDGLCDVSGCNDPDNPDERLPPDPACTDDTTAENEVAECQNGEDDDGDGDVDAEDIDCENPNDPSERPGCSDGYDNDLDGWTDLQDPGCSAPVDHYEYDEEDPLTPPLPFDENQMPGQLLPDHYRYSYATECNDGIDDDGDTRADHNDPGCDDGLDDSESGDQCDDGIDNNGDGWIDQEDVSCHEPILSAVGPESLYPSNWVDVLDDESLDGDVHQECSDFSRNLGPDGQPVDSPIDNVLSENPADGLANAEDPECAFGWDPTGEGFAAPECFDLIDNDGDGWIDAADAQCDAVSQETESDGLAPSGNCADGTDNDSDGWIDGDDPDCSSGAGDEGVFSTIYECNDHDDNDGDGFIDAEDPECPTGKDIHEDR